MHLTSHTPFALRCLMVLGLAAPERVKTRSIHEAFEISEHHLVKVVQTLARLGYVETVRGQDGGVRLVRDPSDITVGRVVREVETDMGVVPCLRSDGEECFITPVCGLKHVLHDATQAFLQHLDGVTLEHLLGDARQRGTSKLKKKLGQRIQLLAPRSRA